MKYFVFLKGVNVSGNTKVDMTILKSKLNENGFTNVITYLNSGNLIIETDKSSSEIKKIVSKVIKNYFNLNLDLIVKNEIELKSILANNPFTSEDIEKSKLLINFMSKNIEEQKLNILRDIDGIIEQMQYKGEVLYIHYINGVGRSKLTTDLIERKLGVFVTGRNIKTIESLLVK